MTVTLPSLRKFFFSPWSKDDNEKDNFLYKINNLEEINAILACPLDNKEITKKIGKLDEKNKNFESLLFTEKWPYKKPVMIFINHENASRTMLSWFKWLLNNFPLNKDGEKM